MAKMPGRGCGVTLRHRYDLDRCSARCCASPVPGRLCVPSLVRVAGPLVSFHSPFHSIGNPSAKYNIFRKGVPAEEFLEVRVEKRFDK